MAKSDDTQELRGLRMAIAEAGVRIRRYTLDRQLSDESLAGVNAIWDEWLTVWRNFKLLAAGEKEAPKALEVEEQLVRVDRKVDLVQRQLVSRESYSSGIRTVSWLTIALALLVLAYLYSHGVRGLDFSEFEPLAEWGPLKYVEVAFWSTFGVLCWLLFLSSRYTARRDFDPWYQPWYITTAARAPFLSIVLMMIILEFAELYGEGTWVQTYLLEEGNKSYFIAFMSFCLGLMSDEASAITRELAGGVVHFVRGAVQKLVRKLKSFVALDAPEK